MTDPSQKDLGILQALLERLEKQRLPWALDLKRRVDAGERVSELDMEQLEEVFANARTLEPLLDKHPELHKLAGQLIHLYNEITARALENEEAAKK